ncbi:MAG: GAF and ANTAR domain-containing protein [Mycobacterium sp.]|nr:GAF and ANTAR domain-containing protein [Mycobacterium sp.]MCB0938658.1 GAF and ANTAR domain-containing protein [Mycobacterium sp.]
MADGASRTEDSLPAAAAVDDTTAATADLAVAATTDNRITPVMLAKMLVRAGDSISDEDELLSVLQRVVVIAHEAIDGADSTGVTIDLGGRTFTAVHTDNRTLRVDSEQYEAGEGPCLHSARTRSVVLVDAAAAADRWPRFAAAAAEEGVLSFLAAPLFTPEQTLGSFNLYGHNHSAFGDLDAEILDLLTTAVSRAIGDFVRFKSERDVAESIQRALEYRAPIEQAKGMLMAIHGIDADEAFNLLRQQSQASNVRLRIIAADLVEQLSKPNTQAGTMDRNGQRSDGVAM